MSKQLGDNLRRLRQKNELTQKQVADALHLDRSTYAYYESGTTEPSMGTSRKLADLFNVSMDVLCCAEERQPYLRVSDSSQESPDLKNMEEDAVLKWYRSLNPEQMERFRKFVHQIKEIK